MKNIGVLIASCMLAFGATSAQAQVNGVGDAREHSLPSGDVIGVAGGARTPSGTAFDVDTGRFAPRPLYQGRAVRRPQAR